MIQSYSNQSSVRLKFSFINEPQKVIIQATSQNDNLQYIGEIKSNRFMNFSDFTNYRITSKSNEFLKIAIGPLVIEFVSKSNYQIFKLQKIIEQYQEKQINLQNYVYNQTREIMRYKQQISELKNLVKDLQLKLASSVSEVKKMKQNQMTEIKKDLNILSRNTRRISEDCAQIKQNTRENSKNLKEIKQIKNKNIQQLKLNNILSFMNNFQLQFINKKMLPVKVSNNELNPQILAVRKQKVDSVRFSLRIRSSSVSNRNKQQNQQQPDKKNKNQQQVDLFLLGKQIDQIKRSNQLKSNKIQVYAKYIQQKQLSDTTSYVLSNIGFDLTVKRKQCWAIKIFKYQCAGFGISLIDSFKRIQTVNQQVNFKQICDRCYLISTQKQIISCVQYQQQIHYDSLDLTFQQGSLIYMQYDPINWKLRFRKHQQTAIVQIKIKPPPKGYAYHPCVVCNEGQNIFELILPGEKLS